MIQSATAPTPPDALQSASLWLAGATANRVLSGGTTIGNPSSPGNAPNDALVWSGDSNLQWAGASVDVGNDTRATTEALYRRLFETLDGRHLYRVWNFVPRINEPENGLETYQQFSYGRSVAFEAAFSNDYEARMPAASAVGTPGNRLVVLALAGNAAPAFWENPTQVPAYRYPPQYGPRAPSFARASSVSLERRHYLFTSGTAAIRGSVSRFPGDVARQTALTLDNLALVAERAGFNVAKPTHGEQRFYRVYLRHVSDYPLVRKNVERRLQRADEVQFLQAEICRADLEVEIEATFIRPSFG